MRIQNITVHCPLQEAPSLTKISFRNQTRFNENVLEHILPEFIHQSLSVE